MEGIHAPKAEGTRPHPPSERKRDSRPKPEAPYRPKRETKAKEESKTKEVSAESVADLILDKKPEKIDTKVTLEMIPISFTLSAKEILYLKQIFPNKAWDIQAKATSHTHPILAIERMLAENEIVHKLQGRVITDIGGNPTRHTNKKRDNIHSCCPVLDPKDAVRAALRSRKADNYCEHKVQECACVETDAYMAIHSIYYLDPMTVLNLVNKAKDGVMYSAHHHFHGIRGTFAGGEATYEVHGSKVTMRARHLSAFTNMKTMTGFTQ